MGRYLTKTEIDYLLAIAFGQAGMPDSSAVYRERVQLAWKDADPEVKVRLDSLTTLSQRASAPRVPVDRDRDAPSRSALRRVHGAARP